MQVLNGLLMCIAHVYGFTLIHRQWEGVQSRDALSLIHLILAVESTERILVEYKRLPVYLKFSPPRISHR